MNESNETASDETNSRSVTRGSIERRVGGIMTVALAARDLSHQAGGGDLCQLLVDGRLRQRPATVKRSRTRRKNSHDIAPRQGLEMYAASGR